MRNVTIGIARLVIEADQHPLRFEAFCREIVSDLEGGVHCFSTSFNYDQGRDVKSVGRGLRLVACCSLTDQVDSKALSDVKKNVSTGRRIDKFYFCSSKPLTEYRADGLRDTIAQELKEGTEVEVLGNHELADHGRARSEILWKHYSGDIESTRKALLDDGADPGEAQALQLALCTIGNNDTSALRNAIWTACLRRVLADGRPRTQNECARDAAVILRLERNLPIDVVRLHLDTLIADKEVDLDGDRYILSEIGQAQALDDSGRAAAKLLEGRNGFRLQLETSMGQSLEQGQFDRLWLALQQKLTHLFFSRGQEIVASVTTLLESQETVNPSPSASSSTPEHQNVYQDEGHDETPVVVRELAEAAAATATLREQKEELRTAVSDILRNGSGPGFDWMFRACVGFVAICSLGLESKTAEQLERLIADTTLVFDTDVVLSLLCEGEPEHEAVIEIQRRWRQFGGSLAMAAPVLQELGHHAWIAESDFRAVRPWLPGGLEDRNYLIKNAFVRAFATHMAQSKVPMGRWGRYIVQYRGNDQNDFQRIREILLQDYHFGELPKFTEKYAELRKTAHDYLRRIRFKNVEKDDPVHLDKTSRDADLCATLCEHKANLVQTAPGSTCYLVSSSPRLLKLQRKLDGSPIVVLPISAVVSVLSLAPGISLGMSALRSFLFDGKWNEHISPFELTCLRVLKESKDAQMLPVKRTSLRRFLRNNIEQMAREQGRRSPTDADVSRIGDELLKAENTQTMAGMIAQALDNVAVDRRVERERNFYKKRVAELEARLKQRDQGSGK